MHVWTSKSGYGNVISTFIQRGRKQFGRSVCCSYYINCFVFAFFGALDIYVPRDRKSACKSNQVSFVIQLLVGYGFDCFGIVVGIGGIDIVTWIDSQKFRIVVKKQDGLCGRRNNGTQQYILDCVGRYRLGLSTAIHNGIRL